MTKALKRIIAMVLSLVMAVLPLAPASYALAEETPIEPVVEATEPETTTTESEITRADEGESANELDNRATNNAESPVLQAAEAGSCNVWVGGTEVTTDNASDVFGDGTVSYDAASKTLTLNGYTYEGAGHEKSAIYAADDLAIVATGTNSLTSTGSGGFGIYAKKGLSISGYGEGATLNVTTATTNGYDVKVVGATASFKNVSMAFAGNRALVVNENNTETNTISITGCTMTFSEGLDRIVSLWNETGSGAVTIDSSTLTGSGQINMNTRTEASGDLTLTIQNSSEINITGAKTSGRHAIELLSDYGDSSLVIDSSKVTVKNSNASDAINVGTQHMLNGKGSCRVDMGESTVVLEGARCGLTAFTWGDNNTCDTNVTIANSNVNVKGNAYYGLNVYAYAQGNANVSVSNSTANIYGEYDAIEMAPEKKYNANVGDFTYTQTNSDVTATCNKYYGLCMSTKSTEGKNTDSSATATIEGGKFICSGMVCVECDEMSNAELTFTNDSVTSVDSTCYKYYALDTGVLNIDSGKYEFVYQPGCGIAPSYTEGNITGGIYNDDPSDLVVAGYEVVDNPDGETQDPYFNLVGKIVAEDVKPVEDKPGTYTVTKKVVDSNNEPVATQTITIVAKGAAEGEVSDATTKLEQFDVAQVVEKAIEEVGASVDEDSTIEVTLVVKSNPLEGAADGTLAYEVHPEAIVVIDGFEEDATTLSLDNDDLAKGAKFSFSLSATGLVDAAGQLVCVTHQSEDPDYPTDEVSYVAAVADGEGFSVPVTTSHFSAWLLAKAYTVTFNANGGSSVEAQSVTAGKKATKPSSTKTGYTLEGWFEEGATTAFDFNTTIEKDYALTARWTANTYKVHFVANGGKGTMADQSFTYGTAQALSKNAFTRSGYTFTGWNTKKNGKGTSYKDKQSVKNLTAKANASVTLYAQWKKNAPAPAPTPTTKSVTYTVCVQGKGTLKAVKDGAVAGTIGQGRRLEAITARVSGGSIEYRSHVQGKGWETAWVKDGGLSGTTGQAKRLEAIQMRLDSTLAKDYSVWYQVHSQSYGWLGWAKDGAVAGTAGLSKRVEACRVVVLPKGQTPKGYVEGQTSYVGAAVGNMHVQTRGWLGNASSLRFGTTGQGKRLEAIQLKLTDQPCKGGIEYQSHVQGKGWEKGWAANGKLSGTTGQSKRIEAVRIRLTPNSQLAKQFDVWYRVHSQTYGWSGWAKNGAPAGTSGLSKRVEAIEVQIQSMGSAAPGSTAHAMRTK